MKEAPIYLDYMATTPLAPEVATAMGDFLSNPQSLGNAASRTHPYGVAAHNIVEAARADVAALINAKAEDIRWTSGATESNNIAIMGAAKFHKRNGNHIITMATEHKAVLNPCVYLESQGFEVTYLKPMESGLLDLDALREAISNTTILVSIMHVNNETGVIQDVAAIAEIVHEHGAIFHVDAAQSAGKLPINIKEHAIDLLSLTAHKIYGPQGVGALYIRSKPRVRLDPITFGGAQERGLRPGTLPTHQILGMGLAFAIAKTAMQDDFAHGRRLANQFWEDMQGISQLYLNGSYEHRYHGCFNMRIAGIDTEALIYSLPELALSQASACNSVTATDSHVLSAMGLNSREVSQSLRVSFGRYSSAENMATATRLLKEKITHLRLISPSVCQ